MESTRAKAQLNREQTDQFYTGNLANIAPGLTAPLERMIEATGKRSTVYFAKGGSGGVGLITLELETAKRRAGATKYPLFPDSRKAVGCHRVLPLQGL
jgi:hypothetical protein